MEMDNTVAAELALECGMCGMQDFYQEGGFYYCSTCQTQSQHSRLFVEEENAGAGASASQFRSRLTIFQDEEAFAESVVRGRKKLSSWEVFNLVLRALTEKLISLGFPQILRDVVFDLYATYLMKRKAIFVSEEQDKPSAITHLEPKTNIYSLYERKRTASKNNTEEMVIKKKKLAEKKEDPNAPIRRRRASKKKALEQGYLDYVSDGERSVKSAYGKKVEEASAEIPVRSKEGKSLVYTEAYTHVRREIAKHINLEDMKPYDRRGGMSYHVKKFLTAEAFTMKSVLMLLFVALRKVGCRVLFSDVIRMYHEGTLRIESIANILPEEEANQIDLGCNEFLRCGAPGTSLKFRYFLRPFEGFLAYLGISDFRYPTYKEFIPKFMDDLKLPREFECLLYQLNRTLSIQHIVEGLSSKSTNPLFFKLFPEFLILSMITVKLKLLFGLDGTTEKYQSRYAQLVNKIINDNAESAHERQKSKKEWSQLFVIEDWFSYLRYRSLVIAKELHPTSQATPNLKTVDRLIKESPVVSRTSYATAQACDSIKSIFQEAVVDLTNGQGIPPLPAYQTPSLPHEDVMKTYVDSYPNVAHLADRRKLGLDFSKQRIDFIYQPHKYNPLLRKAGYRVKLIEGDARNCETKFKSSVVPLFQPYKSYDESISSEDYESGSISFLFSLYCAIFPGCDEEEAKEKLRSLVENIGDIMNRHARLPHSIPLVIHEESK